MKNHSIYVTSRTRHAARWITLRSRGWPIVTSWIDEASNEDADIRDLWERIVTEASGAGKLLLYAERDDFPLKGALVEVGVALGAGMPVVACLPGVEVDLKTHRPVGSWINHPLVCRIDDLDKALGHV